MHIRIDHRTLYRYERGVSFSPHLVRLFPRTEPHRLVQRIDFSTNDGASVQFRRDLFDNNFARCFYPEVGSELTFHLHFEIELEEHNPFDFLLDGYAAEYPFQHQPGDLLRLQPYLASAPSTEPKLLPLPFWAPPPAPVATVSLLIELLGALNQNIGYERREDGPARSAAETVRLGRGACRDTAVLMAAVLRELGFAARLASGYLSEVGAVDTERRADGAMHMWNEVYLPGAGWTSIDPTNGIFSNHNFITTAVGLSTAEVTPISGRYFGNEYVPSEMIATLEIKEVPAP